MNKVLKWVALGALGILVIGIGVLMAGKCLGGSLSFAYNLKDREFIQMDEPEMVENTIEIEDFDDLAVYVSSTDVTVSLGDKNEVYYKVREDLEPEVTCENGKLTVKNKNNGIRFNFMTIDNTENVINITVDKNSLKNIDIDKSSGDLTFEGLDIKGTIHSSAGEVVIKNCEKGEDLFVEASAGDIKISDSSFAKLEKDQSAGSTTLTNVKADEYKNDSSSGSNELTKCEFGKFGSKASAGSTKVSDSKLGDLTLDNSAGGFTAQKCEIGSVDAQMSAGTLNLEIIGEKNDYNYDLEIAAGDVEIDGTDIKGDYKDDNGASKIMKIDASAGDINITFAE